MVKGQTPLRHSEFTIRVLLLLPFPLLTVYPLKSGFSIPIIPGAVAGATAVGGSGTLTGDVSQPGSVTALPFSAFSFDTGVIDMTEAVFVAGIQMFVGSQSGSPVLPTITGTPIHAPSGIPGSNNEFENAAKIEMLKGVLDLSGIFPGFLPDGLIFATPEISFVAPGSSLAPNEETYFPVDIPVRIYGEDPVRIQVTCQVSALIP